MDPEAGVVFSYYHGLSAMGIGRFQILLLLYAGLGLFGRPMQLLMSMFLGQEGKEDHSIQDINPFQRKIISMFTSAGTFLGGFLWGYIADLLGRRFGILGAAATAVFSGCLSPFANSFVPVLILRTLHGIGVGGDHVYATWFTEFLPSNNRAVWMVAFELFGTFGGLLQAWLMIVMKQTVTWRWLLAASTSPHVLSLLFFPMVLESPRFLYSQARTLEAETVLRQGARFNKRRFPAGNLFLDGRLIDQPKSLLPQLPFKDRAAQCWGRLLDASKKFKFLSLRRSVTRVKFMDIYHSIAGFWSWIRRLDMHFSMAGFWSWIRRLGVYESMAACWSWVGLDIIYDFLRVKFWSWAMKFRILCDSNWTGTTFLLCFLYLSSGFSYYEQLFIANKLSGGWGASSKLMYNEKEFHMVFLSTLGELPGLLLSSIMLTYFRSTHYIGLVFLAGCGVTLPMLFYQNDVLTMAWFFLSHMCVSACLVVIKIYTQEVYPTHLRGTGMGFASSPGSIGGILWPLLAPKVDGWRVIFPLIIFAVKLALCACSAWFLPQWRTSLDLE